MIRCFIKPTMMCQFQTFFARKSAEHTWSYGKILAKIGINLHKELNRDPYRAYFTRLYSTKKREEAARIIFNFIVGLIFWINK